MIEYCGEESKAISYQYDNWSVLNETHETPSGSYSINYSYRDDDSPQAITINPADGGTSATYYYLTDGHGDVREITDKQGNTLVKYSYNAFGSISTKWINPSSELQPSALQLSAVSPYTYSSYRYDTDTGMYYLRARYYDPVIGRFLSKDPVLKGSISNEIDNIAEVNPFAKEAVDQFREQKQYVYAGNNPVNTLDSSGQYAAKIHFPHNKGDDTNYLVKILRVNAGWAFLRRPLGVWKYLWFYLKVRNRGPWDVKRAAKSKGKYGRTVGFMRFRGGKVSPMGFGNIHYGYVGHALGISLGGLMVGSFSAYIRSQNVNTKAIKDKYKDQQKIRYGYNLFWRYGISIRAPWRVNRYVK